MKKRSKKNTKNETYKYIICILLILAIIVILYVAKCVRKKGQEDVVVKTSALRLEESSILSEELTVDLTTYKALNEFDLCNYEFNYCDKDSLIIKTEDEEAYLLENYKYKYFFYADGDKIKLFDASVNKSYSIDKLNADYTTDFIIDSDDNFLGVVYSENMSNHSSYLLIDGNEILYKNKYDYISVISSKYLAANKYNDEGNQVGAYIIDATKEERPLITKEYETNEYYGFYELGKKYITFEYDKILEIYDKDTLKLIYQTKKANSFDGDGNPRLLVSADSNDNIYIYDDKYLSIIDKDGKEIKKSEKEIFGNDLVDKYVISTFDNELSIIDIDNNKTVITSLENGAIDYYEYTERNGSKGLVFDVYDNKVTFKEVYNSCKETRCKGVTFEEFEKDYKDCLGYQYFFDYNTSKVSKTPTIIEPTNIAD